MTKLHDSIRTLSESVTLLDESLKTLTSTTNDIPRIQKVLHTRRVFGLVPESDMDGAKRMFQGEIEPWMKLMVERVEKDLDKITRRRTNLKNKCDLQVVRIASAAAGKVSETPETTGSPERKIATLKLSHLKFLQNKKNRLKYTLSRRNLQEKKLRLSGGPILAPP